MGTTVERRTARKKSDSLARRAGFGLRTLACGIATATLAAYLLLYIAPLPEPPAVDSRPDSTKIFDREGRLLYDSAGPKDSHFTAVRLDELPLSVRQAVIATEDSAFFRHAGVDPWAIARAGFDNASHGSLRSGGSTITQQLARNLYLDPEDRTLTRKVRETFLALQLERALSKDEILERYLNEVYFGNLAYGVEAAAQTYFGKSARDLDLAEGALLAGLLQGPSLYDPFVSFAAAKVRQSSVLRLMAEAGFLSEQEAAAALAERLQLSRTPFPIQAPHFVAHVLAQLPSLLGVDAAVGGGLRVYTSLDVPLQTAAEQSLVRHLETLDDRNVTSGAVVAVDPDNGHLLAMVGSIDYFDASRAGAVNAALAERQPGSAIKAVVYAAALEQGYTPSSPLLDIPTALTTRQGELYAPNNYDLTFHGVVPLREALASSYNVPAVRLLREVGVEAAFRLGQRLGLTSFRNPDDYDLSLTLGGGEVRLLDLTVAYAAFAAGGLRVDPVFVLRIEDASGKTLFEAPAPERPRVLSVESAYLISDILSDNEARAPAFGLNSALSLERPAAVKTGTTSDFRDNWTVGYTPGLVVGVWVGNADGSPMRDVSGVDGAAPIWRDVILAGLQGSPAAGFVAPASIERLTVCLPSGLLPTPDCQRKRIEVFAPGTQPAREDDYYVRGACQELSEATAGCSRVFSAVGFEAIPWARRAGLELPASPPLSGRAIVDSAVLRLVSPPDGLVLSLSRDLPAADQVLPIEALPDAEVRLVEIVVNGRLIARFEEEPFRLFWQISQGDFVIEARAVDRSGKELWSQPSRLLVLPP